MIPFKKYNHTNLRKNTIQEGAMGIIHPYIINGYYFPA
jgi:hypothetical protein